MQVYYNPVVHYLLMADPEKMVEVLYANNSQPFLLPLVWKRPPYYTNPRYESYMPVI